MELVQITKPKITPPLRHPAVEEFVKEISNFWTRIGAVKNCISCHKGEFEHKGYGGWIGSDNKSRGCCPSTCPHLSSTGCIGKPIGCALYSCGTWYGRWYGKITIDNWDNPPFHATEFSKAQWQQVCDLLVKLRNILDGTRSKQAWSWELSIPIGCYPTAYERELEYKWTPAKVKRLRRATALLVAFKFKRSKNERNLQGS